MNRWGRWRIGLLLVFLATAVRLCWVLAVPTIPVGDFATYRESAIYLAEFGHLDSGFVYMPGLVALLAGLHRLGGEVLAAKLLGVLFGGLAAGAVYVVAARLVDNGRPAQPGQPGPTSQLVLVGAPVRAGTGAAPEAGPVALVAGLAYAFWPAGIALSSVIGTDIPTAALILAALAWLGVWGSDRPNLAAIAFGATMGVAAYFRAVALPLTVLSAGYWGARRAGAGAVVTRTALATVVTVLLLVPWGLRNRHQSGELYLTDSHGGVTALMGNDPNSEGTYSRSVSTLFRQLTGRTFLMEPHRETDRVAYALARRFITFDLAWTTGMIALRLERLFAPERGLLYWPVYRPGVIPPAATAWFNLHRPAVTSLADWFYVLFVLGVCAGVAFAVVERRWVVLVPVPFAVALAATYALFVAEPRYRVTTEAVLFPLVGFGMWRFATSTIATVRPWSSRFTARRRVAAPMARSSPDDREAVAQEAVARAEAHRGLGATLIAVVILMVIGSVVVRGGEALRARHRWAATVWQCDGRPTLAQWRRASAGPAGGDPSPVRGAPPGAALRLLSHQSRVAAEIVLPDLPKSKGPVQVDASIAWRGAAGPGTVLVLGGASAGPDRTRLHGWIEPTALDPSSGPLRVTARLERDDKGDSRDARDSDARGQVEVVISDVVLTSGGAVQP